ncbi:Co2+/Mg2+ efflux protein ApaG [Chryseobacterium sp. POL2]|uniref:Co2+/Mg2+ efflux protein ApaG n=1 Tax=Chryseobacterium sp. POL2 TaxID=2713414 RepID=UPI0013E11BF9|nr:Co2+/Mg2+ efflux protein ApaG [Chryseobacterium sp. POL2]QIG90722.1 Co2+/Mg2+ efflux protein ApaG [Chryseobacterium sp. POL2]
MVSKTTSQIQVTVHTEYDAKNSFPLDFRHTFRYYIIIENKGQEKVKLLRRRWQIFDVGFGQSFVEGEGVIGLQPIIEPGQVFKYFSNVVLQSGIGNMTGQYLFVNINSNETFEVEIPKFSLFSEILNN